MILDCICTCNPSLNWSWNVFRLRTSRYIFYPEGMLFLHNFMSGFGAISIHVTLLVIGVPCTGKCVCREQTDCTVCSMPMDLPLRLECKEHASHKPTGIGDEVSRRILSSRAHRKLSQEREAIRIGCRRPTKSTRGAHACPCTKAQSSGAEDHRKVGSKADRIG